MEQLVRQEESEQQVQPATTVRRERVAKQELLVPQVPLVITVLQAQPGTTAPPVQLVPAALSVRLAQLVLEPQEPLAQARLVRPVRLVRPAPLAQALQVRPV